MKWKDRFNSLQQYAAMQETAILMQNYTHAFEKRYNGAFSDGAFYKTL
jgi:hypothetical protein